MKYVALLRGINVGGNNKVPMSELKTCFQSLGYLNIRTYINSGNVLFESSETNQGKIRSELESAILKHFGFAVTVVVIDSVRYQQIIQAAPKWWGKEPSWKHNLVFLVEPYIMEEVVQAVGILKPEIEALSTGDGVLYQSMSFDQFGKTTTGKLASNPVYKKMTIRNYNTSLKLADLLQIDYIT